MSQNLPQPSPSPQPDQWSRFSADPRTAGMTRSSDADRAAAVQVLNEAYAEGRLDNTEHADRVDRALASKELGELVPLLSDVVPVYGSWTPPASAPTQARFGSESAVASFAQGKGIRMWLALAAMFNVIWLFTWLPFGQPYYYWPMWPMLGTALPLMFAGMRGDASGRGEQKARQERPGGRELR